MEDLKALRASRGKRLIVLIDSWSWIEYFQGSAKGEKVRKYIEEEGHIIVSTINIAEVFRHMLAHGTEKDADAAAQHILKSAFVIPVSTAIAIEAAKIKHERKWGLGDSIILATARQNNAKVVTGDDDFKDDKDAVFIK